MHLEGNENDVPWVGLRLRPDMVPQARDADGLIVGLGASNPKALVTTPAEVARVIHAAGIPRALLARRHSRLDEAKRSIFSRLP